LSGNTAMGGPPVVLFLSNREAEKQVFRANLTFHFPVVGLSMTTSQVMGAS